MNQEEIIKVLPREHIRMRQIGAKETYLLASRGSWKSTVALPLYVKEKVEELPRSTGVIVGLSFDGMDDNTINPMLRGLATFGYHDGIHFVYGKRPPKSWPKPYQPIINDKYEHVITFFNGTVIQLISLARMASANGVSAQWGIFDEVKFMDQYQLTTEIFPIFRGNEEHFKIGELEVAGEMKPIFKSGMFSKMFCTDKEADPVKIQWLLDKRKLVDPEAVEIAIAYHNEIYRLWEEEYHAEGAGQVRKAKTLRLIGQYELELAAVRTDMVYVAEISIDDVAPFMSKEWYRDKRRNSTEIIWNSAYKNKDPEGVGDKFYPFFKKEIHGYSVPGQEDVDPHRSLIITMDYGHSLAPLTVCQLSILPGRTKPSLNYIDEVYTLAQSAPDRLFPNGNGSPGNIEECVQLFSQRYKKHPKRVIYYVYDHTAIGRRAEAEEYFKIVKRLLRNNGWFVQEIYTGKAPRHFGKYTRTSAWLKASAPELFPDTEMHSDPNQLTININTDRCPRLITSITGAKAKIKGKETEKDKSYEDTSKYPMLDQSMTTHFSDNFDMTNHAVLHLKKIRYYAVTTGTSIGK
ncbi:MAG: hypothetical protein EOP50_00165 [Sphingobacteriales bacterium]|nr:MAG: hypothetical protein EOP50_00165 [Sphingobacteriales bacterium]